MRDPRDPDTEDRRNDRDRSERELFDPDNIVDEIEIDLDMFDDDSIIVEFDADDYRETETTDA